MIWVAWLIRGRYTRERSPISVLTVATHLFAVLFVLLHFVGATSSKKTQRFVVSNEIGMKFGRIVLQVNTCRSSMRLQGGGHDVGPLLNAAYAAAQHRPPAAR